MRRRVTARQEENGGAGTDRGWSTAELCGSAAYARPELAGARSSPGSGRGRAVTDSGLLRHIAVFYRDPAEYQAQILRFARDGLAQGEPLLIALPGGAARAVAGQLPVGSRDSAELLCSHTGDLARNPARIIPEVQALYYQLAGRRVRVVGEPGWPGRSPAEICEVIRHEALLNLAFAGAPATLLCPYDAARLTPAAISGAEHTHPERIFGDGQVTAAETPAAPEQVPPGCDRPLPPVPPGAERLEYETDLAPVRRLVESHARRAGLAADRVADLVLAVNEIAANTLAHTTSGGLLRVWHDEAEVLCQVQDHGYITDPLAGRVKRSPDGRGHGLFLVNQVCDLVELRTGPGGTTVLMHMSLGSRGSA
jgi:anti-sigma regulatory factor (Ser/Thr protein kinase)